MHCASCAMNIERKLKRTKGVSSVAVNYGNDSAYVEYDPKVCRIDDIANSVKSVGYTPHLDDTPEKAEEDKRTELHALKSKVIISAVLTIPLLLGAMLNIPGLNKPLVQLLLASPVQFWVGWQYYQSAWSGLKNRLANMDTLVALGTSVAYFYSLATLVFKLDAHIYFETSATIITLILLGKYFELSAKGATGEAIKKLLDLSPKTALLLKGNEELVVPVSELKIGDILRVKPGDKIPVDGLVVSGETSVNESMITGESMPIGKIKGQEIIGGTVNISGSIDVKASKIGADTVLSNIIEMVKKAQGSRAPIQRLADTISGYFVPIVIILSLATFLAWFNLGTLSQALTHMVSVLIIACPCALGLATPTSIMVATGRGASLGVLVKNAEVLELADKTKVALLDKTGTLTAGEPAVQDVVISSTKFSDAQVKAAVRSIETLSNHPLALAIVSGLQGKISQISSFHDHPGRGVSGSWNGSKILIGTESLLKNNQVKLSENFAKKTAEWASSGWSVVHIAISGAHVGSIAIADTIRKDSVDVIKYFKRENILPVMVTGDSHTVARAVAAKIGISIVESEVMPEDKQSLVAKYQKDRGIVMMVGDGINDAPALAASDVGVAMGGGTDVAIESAGVTLLRSDIKLIPTTISLAKKSMQNIRQNLGWAFGYNIILIPVAMGALYPIWGIELSPMLAGAAMAFSSVSVVTNSLRLKRVKLNK